MTTAQLSKALSLTPLTSGIDMDSEITGCYVGDLLSWVMGRAPANCAWITVMGNINAIAVAQLKDISCIILCENATLDKDAKAQAEIQGISVFSAGLPAYALAVRIAVLLGDAMRPQ